MDFKEQLVLTNLYRVGLRGGVSGVGEQLAPSIWVNDGSVSIYVSNSETQPTSLAEMTLNDHDTGIEGIREFALIPTWMVITQVAGTSTEVVVSGLFAEDYGTIS